MNFTIESNRIHYTAPDGRVLAEITFPQIQPGQYCIDHTFVDSALRGQGVAGTLVSLAVAEIRRKGGKVTATCSYAKRWLENHETEV